MVKLRDVQLQIIEVQSVSYRSSDGKIYTSKTEAEYAERAFALEKYLKEDTTLDYDDYRLTELVAVIMTSRKELLDILSTSIEITNIGTKL